jgi:hypothetical protein
MELQYLLMDISFSDADNLAHPCATVRIRPTGIDPHGMSAAFVDIKIKLFDIVPPGADLTAIATAAVQSAQAMIQPMAMALHLQATLDRELREKQRQDAQMARGFEIPPTSP